MVLKYSLTLSQDTQSAQKLLLDLDSSLVWSSLQNCTRLQKDKKDVDRIVLTFPFVTLQDIPTVSEGTLE